ncbi:Fur family transcriptional regulator [Natranaerobius trueperi]|uniref:Transcriptional repressor n=1 Tax=Natranaerobius trueperi TaxID=759412 RepID=A0A226BY47_9FIRM|nr:Fur family transcriptional regulator [Natranaerobius trueperi]OWZ83855.1 transcriptional repressor [Natranaerobius trueperi]
MNDSSVLEKIKSRFSNYKLTPQREAILEIFLENPDWHLSAKEILNLVSKKYPNIGIATVYRSLKILEELGIIQEINFEEDQNRYELTISQQEHHHLLCLKCQSIIEIRYDLLENLKDSILNEHNFEVKDLKLQFHGYCSKCSD